MRLTFGRTDEPALDPVAVASLTGPVAPPAPLPSSPVRPSMNDQQALANRLAVLMRGPLAHAGGVVEALLAGSAGELPDAVRAHLVDVAEETRRLRKAVRDVEALGNPVEHDPGDVRLTIAEDWLRRSVALHEPRATARGTTLHLGEIQPDLLVRGVPDALESALHQLLDNAVNATGQGNSVTVEAAADGQRLLVRVRDDGMGFDPAEATKLTGCYCRSRIAQERDVPGLGVGLFLADRIARQHGGAVRLRGEPGAGATVWLELPQA